jgi:hypothetical protein
MAAQDSALIGDALQDYYTAHGLPADGGASDKWFHVKLGPVSIPLPNPPARRRAVFFHDVNHLLTGYNTVFSEGEVEIAGFEIGAGCGPYWIAWAINAPMFAIGLVINPKSTWRAFQRGRRSGSIYQLTQTPEDLSARTVGELRAALRIATIIP